MYAVIRTGGKQYRVQAGDVLQVEKLEQALGSEFDINDVLMIGGESTHVGQPTVKNAKVTVVVTKQAKTRKLIVFKKKRRHSYRNFQTHRQEFTELFVKAITSPDGKTAKTDATPKVVDVAASRVQRIEDKVAARIAATEALIGKGRAAAKSEKKAAAKPAAKKAAPKKAAAKGGKKPAAKKAAAKKTTKKATK